MLILLPPSEGKAGAGDGPVLDLSTLSFPSLPRQAVLDALTALCEGSRARAVLGLSEGQLGEIDKNRLLRTVPTLTAAGLYTGVLYDNLGLASLPPEAAVRAQERLLIFSGLWGLLRITDRIPPYRLSMGVNLPPLGGLGAFWRRSVTPVLDAEPGLVVDLRSSTYAAAWRPGDRAVAVRVLKDGKVVSHMAKATRGAIARSLLLGDVDPQSPDELVKVLDELGHTVALGPAPTGSRSWTVDVLT
ncbi:peroxide stress protein YaaA [Planomonospora sp. ID67723]|uniref:YaaA family protein n=1 Tax=Planomonospora sp. ID67723 TaxID=2738134 RepID=UPI0018C40067|nr:peroxide stress protein YaaA [Planomonospora sp. ID67723]MBG0830600.1 peroxide stress protein YaaA [Planomonospora sp. ID67723]